MLAALSSLLLLSYKSHPITNVEEWVLLVLPFLQSIGASFFTSSLSECFFSFLKCISMFCQRLLYVLVCFKIYVCAYYLIPAFCDSWVFFLHCDKVSVVFRASRKAFLLAKIIWHVDKYAPKGWFVNFEIRLLASQHSLSGTECIYIVIYHIVPLL